MIATRAGATTMIAVAMTALLAALAWTGNTPGNQMLQRFQPGGIVAADPADIRKLDLRVGKERIGLHRTPEGKWAFDDGSAPEASPAVASHIETALRFMHVSAPTRTFEAADANSVATFGLEPPVFVLLLGAADKTVISADFGTLNPAETAQYVRLAGGQTIYLMPRHVGSEWRLVVDLAKRDRPEPNDRAAQPLLPASIDQCWAIEIVVAGKLHRFERDSARHWFLHVGQHTHDGTTPAHVADPVKAPIIDAGFTAFGETTIDAIVAHHPSSRERERFGLDRPTLIALLYPRDSSTPIARVEIGGTAAEGYGRYAQLSQADDIVTIAPDSPQRLIDLLRDVGATG